MYNEEKWFRKLTTTTSMVESKKHVCKNMFFASFEEFFTGTAPSMFETMMVLIMIFPFILVGANNFGINTGFDFIVHCFSTVSVAAVYIGTLSGILFLSRSIRYVKCARKNVAVI